MSAIRSSSASMSTRSHALATSTEIGSATGAVTRVSPAPIAANGSPAASSPREVVVEHDLVHEPPANPCAQPALDQQPVQRVGPALPLRDVEQFPPRQQRRPVDVADLRRVQDLQLAAVLRVVEPTVGEPRLRARVERGYQDLQRPRSVGVVVVQESEQFPARHGHPVVARRSPQLALVLRQRRHEQALTAQPRVPRELRVRTVADDQVLPVLVGLRAHARDAALDQQLAALPGRRDHAHPRQSSTTLRAALTQLAIFPGRTWRSLPRSATRAGRASVASASGRTARTVSIDSTSWTWRSSGT